jgi:hypothetical protein
MKSKLLQRIEAASLRLEERGRLYRDGFCLGPDGEPAVMWCAPGGGDVAELMLGELKRDLAAEDKGVFEIRDGVELYFNMTAVRPDGWYWGIDDAPFLYGPFADSEAALEDARAASNEPVKVVVDDLMSAGEGEHSDGYVTITVIDTDGEVCRTAREVREGVVAAGRGKPS